MMAAPVVCCPGKRKGWSRKWCPPARSFIKRAKIKKLYAAGRENRRLKQGTQRKSKLVAEQAVFEMKGKGPPTRRDSRPPHGLLKESEPDSSVGDWWRNRRSGFPPGKLRRLPSAATALQ